MLNFIGYLRSHGSSRHLLTSNKSPVQLSIRQVLLRNCLPPPQGTEHSLHSLHSSNLSVPIIARTALKYVLHIDIKCIVLWTLSAKIYRTLIMHNYTGKAGVISAEKNAFNIIILMPLVQFYTI